VHTNIVEEKFAVGSGVALTVSEMLETRKDPLYLFCSDEDMFFTISNDMPGDKPYITAVPGDSYATIQERLTSLIK